jgi:hypothetical protein
VNENTAIERISELENRVRSLTQERDNYAATIVNYEAFLKKIPTRLPNGDPCDHEFTLNSWLEWAKEQLGYEKSD